MKPNHHPVDPQWTPNGRPMDAQWTPNGNLFFAGNRGFAFYKNRTRILLRSAKPRFPAKNKFPLGVHWASIGRPLGVHWVSTGWRLGFMPPSGKCKGPRAMRRGASIARRHSPPTQPLTHPPTCPPTHSLTHLPIHAPIRAPVHPATRLPALPLSLLRFLTESTGALEVLQRLLIALAGPQGELGKTQQSARTTKHTRRECTSKWLSHTMQHAGQLEGEDTVRTCPSTPATML